MIRLLPRRCWALPLLLILFAMVVSGIPKLSLTYDEPSHLAAGYAYVARGRAGMWTIPLRGHPLLINGLSALPLYLANPDLDVEDLSGWGADRRSFAHAFIHAIGPISRVTFAARYPIALLSVVLGAVLFCWAADRWGYAAGGVALALLAFDPTWLAHGRLATNDAGVTVLGTFALYLVGRWLRRREWKQAVGAGLLLGLTLLAKSSGVLWAGAAGLAALWALRRPPEASATHDRRRTFAQLLAMGGVALLVVWAMYGFSFGPITLLPRLPRIPVPAPLHWESVLFQTQETGARPFYALGDLDQGRRWWYFPFAFAIKNPVALLIALALALALSLTRRRMWRALHPLPLFAALYLIIAITHGPNIGYRHLLPVHPLFYLLIAGTLAPLWAKRGLMAQIGLSVLSLGYAATTLWITPHEIAFFNLLAGGSDNGWYYLSDSNTDWMQGPKALKSWQEATGIRFRYAGPEGYVGLAAYDLDYEPLPSTRYNPEPTFDPAFVPPPGDYVISAHAINGLGVADPDNYAWFRYHRPDDVIAHVLFYYHVDPPPEENDTWLVQCAQPVAPLDEATVETRFGSAEPRRLIIPCEESWVYPGGGRTPGWYVLHDQLLQPMGWLARLRPRPAPQTGDRFFDRHLSDFSLTYRQTTYRRQPAFALFAWDGRTTPRPSVVAHYSAPASVPPRDLAEAPPISESSVMTGPLTFLGASAYLTDDAADVRTWWQVTDGPLERPLSIMAHLVTADGEAVAQDDGLGFPPSQWRAGDIIVQRHQFAAQKAGTCLRTGVYWLDNGERWRLQDAPAYDAIFVPLQREW